MKSMALTGLLFLFASCGVKQKTIHYGKATVADLISEKGEPIKEESIPVKDSKLLVYPDNEKYQVDGDVVTHGFKDPKGDEKAVIYWKHQFKDCNTSSKALAQKSGHTPPEIELSCDEQGVSVVYQEGSEVVTRIIQHEKK